MDATVWLAIVLVLAVLEVVTIAFYALFAAFGALVAALLAGLGVPLAAQVVAFAGVSLGGVVVLRRPLVRAMHLPSHRRLVSGFAGYVGQHGTVVAKVVDEHTAGRVRVRGEAWPAITLDRTPLEEGVKVLVVEVQDGKLLVTADELLT